MLLQPTPTLQLVLPFGASQSSDWAWNVRARRVTTLVTMGEQFLPQADRMTHLNWEMKWLER
ncbi:MAG TPA: hypothetical protein VKV39_02490 [Candidatus Sulfotelmatobacter sp.]|nr:hypothetical protein [Candidatus Sulfotelmatobacter sp.]